MNPAVIDANRSTVIVARPTTLRGDRAELVYDAGTITLLGSADLLGIGPHLMVRGQFRPGGHHRRLRLSCLCS